MKRLMVPIFCFLLIACDDDDDNDNFVHEIGISVENATGFQPFSVPVVIVHEKEYEPWTIGEPATLALERLAESGDYEDFIQEVESQSAVYRVLPMGDAVLNPGERRDFRVEWPMKSAVQLTVVAKMMATNDGIAAVTREITSSIDSAEHPFAIYALDTGTEFNTEHAEDLPISINGGPKGEGFGAERAGDRVTAHTGVISRDGGLLTSSLDSRYRFKNPVGYVALDCLQCHQ